MNLTDEDVDEILKLLDSSPYDELKLTTGRFTLELRSRGDAASVAPEAVTEQPHDSPADTPKTDRERAPAAADGEIVDIYPPLPGTFYRAPSPGAEPFTEVGKSVGEDTIVGLVETMKLMNSVTAGCRGEVVEICKPDGTMVEVGDVLLRIRAAADG